MTKKSKKGKTNTISIPASLYKKLEERIEGTDFDSVSSYATYVLQEITSEDDEKERSYSKEDEEKIKERLKDLGYLR